MSRWASLSPSKTRRYEQSNGKRFALFCISSRISNSATRPRGGSGDRRKVYTDTSQRSPVCSKQCHRLFEQRLVLSHVCLSMQDFLQIVRNITRSRYTSIGKLAIHASRLCRTTAASLIYPCLKQILAVSNDSSAVLCTQPSLVFNGLIQPRSPNKAYHWTVASIRTDWRSKLLRPAQVL